jgi:hypothetical protein
MKTEHGVLVASDKRSEWLLPWWWQGYSKHNHLPVCFIDWGLSSSMQKFCQEKGDHIVLSDDVIVPGPSQISSKCVQEWETIYGKSIWQVRKAWFRKPVSMLHSPYQHTLWLDLDCEVLGSIDSLFIRHKKDEFVLAEETEGARRMDCSDVFCNKAVKLYNSGVILFKRNSSLLRIWAEKAGSYSSILQDWGDQRLLSRIIFETGLSVVRLEDRYNWRMSRGINIYAVVVHWAGEWGKQFIVENGGVMGVFYYLASD